MNEIYLAQLLGSRILSEANDLKRTIPALASDLGIDEQRLQQVVYGRATLDEAYEVIRLMGRKYPIDISDLYLVADDSYHGVKIMRDSDSEQSSRIFSRANSVGARAPYYEYRDTAMSALGPFKPEWIRELRVVQDSDPDNPEVAYNNGHFLHQLTFFIGPVNFYWEVNGKKFCSEMNTGDSSYITPFWPHSFTSRNKNQLALIIAITYGGDVRRAQKELYALGERGIRGYRLDYRQPQRAFNQLLSHHLANECLTTEQLQQRVRQYGSVLDVESILGWTKQLSAEDIAVLARCLHVEPADLTIPLYRPEEEVVVKKKSEKDCYYYPSSAQRSYLIYPLARSSKMPLMKGFDLQVHTPSFDRDAAFKSSLHSYVYNYDKQPIALEWDDGQNRYEDVLHPGDSACLQPFISHAFAAPQGEGSLCLIRVSGSVNLSTQRELSYFSDTSRIIEKTCWFD